MGLVRSTLLLLSLPFVALSEGILGHPQQPPAGAVTEQQQPLNVDDKDIDWASICPDYAKYSKHLHSPNSEGPLSLPFQRPHPKCRTFHSDAVEKVIEDVTSRMADPDLARLFENTFPSTTDTTVKFHTDGSTKYKKKDTGRSVLEEGAWEGPQTFVVTGDITAEWLRDGCNQLSPYLALADKDKAIFNLILGGVNTQAEFVIQSPYCNAFQPPPISDLKVSFNGQDDYVHPAYEPTAVFECKYELDSLGHFLTLANNFHEATGSLDFVNARFLLAIETLLEVLQQQSMPTFDPDTGHFLRNMYTFKRQTWTGTETLNLDGVGNPLANGTGLVRSAFRPSDDATTFGFFIPANAMMAVELLRTAKILKAAKEDETAEKLEQWSKTIRDGVWEHGVVEHAKFGPVFAYEVDGYGSSILMDDANYPSLLALPLMGFVKTDDKVYQNTRKMLLSRASNPYYLQGKDFQGIGGKTTQIPITCLDGLADLVTGPHIGLSNAWPMSLLIQAQTSDDDEEIMGCINFVLKSARLGLIHESIDVNSVGAYTSKRTFPHVASSVATCALSLPCQADTPLRKLVCMGKWRICRDYPGPGCSETAPDIQRFEALQAVV